jgi:hypothetical protein
MFDFKLNWIELNSNWIEEKQDANWNIYGIEIMLTKFIIHDYGVKYNFFSKIYKFEKTSFHSI